MTDAELFQLYLDRNGPDAAAHNLSPANLLFEYQTRRLLTEQVPAKGKVCNLGIGVGAWDDFLGYWLRDRGTLTSVDRDASICEAMRYRQARERHPWPAHVVCADVLERNELVAGSFDVVTIVGSTIAESGGSFDTFLEAAFALLQPEGRLLYADVTHNFPGDQFEQYAARTKRSIVRASLFRPHPESAFYVFLARPKRAIPKR